MRYQEQKEGKEEEYMSNIQRKKQKIKKLLLRVITPMLLLVSLLIVLPFLIGINDAGQRTVVQWPNGTLFVKFNPGIYLQFFGKIKEYGDFLTFDFDRNKAESGATLDQPGINVRYQDGGMGSVFGIARFSLPTDEDTMIALHKAFRSHNGVANKLIKPVTEEAMNLTAGLMNSEDAYATKRAIFTELAKEQVSKGKYLTELEITSVKDETTGKTVYKHLPVIKEGADGLRIHLKSDLVQYGISLLGFQLNDPGFEERTQKQIADKREATMAIITAKANAERAKQEAITAEEKGKANVMTAKYEKEVEKQRAVVDAERAKEVAVIAAQQKVDVAEQQKLQALVVATQKVAVAKEAKNEAEQYKFRQGELKLANILEGEGLAEKKMLIMKADGALAQKLATYEAVMARFATEFGKQKWVPDVMMGSTGDSQGNASTNLINLLTANSLRDLGLNMKITSSNSVVQ